MMKGAIVLGICLLICSIVGGIFVMEQNSIADRKAAKQEDLNKLPEKIMCWGNFDIEPGVAGLYPNQFGKIVYVASENAAVKQGDVLLQVDDRLAELKLVEVEAVAKASEKQYDESKTLVKQYELQRTQQQASLAAAQFEIKKTILERDKILQTLDVNTKLKTTVTELYVEILAQLAERVKVETAKLDQTKLLDVQLKIDQAEAEWNVKKSIVNEAREMLKHYKIVAPSDGMVLAFMSAREKHWGRILRGHAIDFLPNAPIVVKAEVLQEWGRYVKVGQDVEIEDDTYNGPRWVGKIKSISKWYAPTRSPVVEPFRFNDVRTLECIIDDLKDKDPEKATHKSIGQRVRAQIKI